MGVTRDAKCMISISFLMLCPEELQVQEKGKAYSKPKNCAFVNISGFDKISKPSKETVILKSGNRSIHTHVKRQQKV